MLIRLKICFGCPWQYARFARDISLAFQWLSNCKSALDAPGVAHASRATFSYALPVVIRIKICSGCPLASDELQPLEDFSGVSEDVWCVQIRPQNGLKRDSKRSPKGTTCGPKRTPKGLQKWPQRDPKSISKWTPRNLPKRGTGTP